MLSSSQKFIFSILKTFTRTTFTTVVLLLATQQMFGQIVDDFPDNDLLRSVWNGDRQNFTVESQRLRLLAPAETGNSYLSTPSRSINDAVWQFYVRLDFNPSSTNYARVYLVSSQPVLNDTLRGYFVMIGNTADEISLYRQTGSTRTKIIDGLDGRVNTASVEVNVRVTRDATGNWQLLSDVGPTGNY